MDDPSKRQELVQEFINSHVLRHASDHHSPNLPFLHVPLLDWLRYDWVILPLAVVLMVTVATIAARRHKPVPTGLSNAFEAYVVFIRDQISVANLGHEEGLLFTSYFCTLFFFIFSLNIFGLVPLCSTATGNINVTCALALIFFVLAVGTTIWRRGLIRFLKTFVPPGTPWLLLPLLVPIEVISLVVRSAALMIRLFANMLAGHILILTIVGLVLIFSWYALILVLPLVVALFLFELFIAILQAYIFTLLSAVFMGLLLNPEH